MRSRPDELQEKMRAELMNPPRRCANPMSQMQAGDEGDSQLEPMWWPAGTWRRKSRVTSPLVSRRRSGASWETLAFWPCGFTSQSWVQAVKKMVFLECRNLNRALVDCLDWQNNQIIKTGSLRPSWVSNPFYLLTHDSQFPQRSLIYSWIWRWILFLQIFYSISRLFLRHWNQ